jgi:hypothetical protein
VILDIESIRRRLDERFVPLEPMLAGMRLIVRAGQDAAIEECQRILDVTFPRSFAAIVARYDFGHFTMGPVAFCDDGDYFGFVAKMNSRSASAIWWDYGDRPRVIILIANSDRFAILLDTQSENILGLEHGRSYMTDLFVLARDFEYFIRGIGTAILERNAGGQNSALARQIATEVGATEIGPFWDWLAS